MSFAYPFRKEFTLVICFLLLSIGSCFAQATNCGCDDRFDPITEPNELAMCLSDCDDADIPINGNIWLLILGGACIFLAKDKLLTKV